MPPVQLPLVNGPRGNESAVEVASRLREPIRVSGLAAGAVPGALNNQTRDMKCRTETNPKCPKRPMLPGWNSENRNMGWSESLWTSGTHRTEAAAHC